MKQPLMALRLANHTRFVRASTKRRINGGISPRDYILKPPPELQRMPVGQLLKAQRYWGDSRVQKFCRRAAVPESKPLGELTELQRSVIVGMLG